MPLARYAVYHGGPQIWVAPTADDSDGWLATMRHIAIESGAFVVSAPQYIPRSAFPDDFPVPTCPRGGLRPRRRRDRRARGGEVIAGPLYGEEGIVSPTATCAHGAARQALVRRRRPLQPRGRAAGRAGTAVSGRRDGFAIRSRPRAAARHNRSGTPSLAHTRAAWWPLRMVRARTRRPPPRPRLPARSPRAEARRSRRSHAADPLGNPEPQGCRGRGGRSGARSPCPPP